MFILRAKSWYCYTITISVNTMYNVLFYACVSQRNSIKTFFFSNPVSVFRQCILVCLRFIQMEDYYHLWIYKKWLMQLLTILQSDSCSWNWQNLKKKKNTSLQQKKWDNNNKKNPLLFKVPTWKAENFQKQKFQAYWHKVLYATSCYIWGSTEKYVKLSNLFKTTIHSPTHLSCIGSPEEKNGCTEKVGTRCFYQPLSCSQNVHV